MPKKKLDALTATIHDDDARQKCATCGVIYTDPALATCPFPAGPEGVDAAGRRFMRCVFDSAISTIHDDDMTVVPRAEIDRAIRAELAKQLQAETLRADRAEAALQRCRARLKAAKKRTS